MKKQAISENFPFHPEIGDKSMEILKGASIKNTVFPLEERKRSRSQPRLEVIKEQADFNKYIGRYEVGPFPMKQSQKCLKSLHYDHTKLYSNLNKSLDTEGNV